MVREGYIDYFLKCYKEIAKEYPDFYMSSNYFYEELRRYGINNYNENLSYQSFFEYWEDRYKNVPNIKVYPDKRQPGFLQFANSHHKSNHLKIYLSLPAEKLQVGANLVFDYLARNNIGHQSKIAKKDRSDVVVLRLEDVNDTPRVLNFINNNKYLQESSRVINPFTMNNGIAGVTFDGLLSYNMTVALVLEKYFSERKNTNYLDSISLNDFKKYVSSFYNNTFVTKNKINEFMETTEVQKELLRLKQSRPYDNQVQEKALLNYKYVVSNIDMSLNSNNCNDLINNYIKYKNDIDNPYAINKFSTSNINGKEFTYSEQLLKEYVWYAYNKYGQDINKIKIAIFSYINGNRKSITRDNHFRQKFEENLTTREITRITNANPSEYVNNALEELLNKTNLYEDACVGTYKKYGEDQLTYAVAKSLNNDFSAFTNDIERLRDKLVEKVNKDEIKYCISTILASNVNQEMMNNPQELVQNIVSAVSTTNQSARG